MNVSFYHKLGKIDSTESLSINEYLKAVKEDTFQIEGLQSRIRRATEQKAKNMKLRLPSITPSALLSTREKEVDLVDKLISHSGFINLDIDDLSKKEVLPLKRRLSQDKYTYSVHESIRGKGLTLLIKVEAILMYGNRSVEFHHKNAFCQILQHYEGTYGITIDPLLDVARLRFLSVDKKVFINDDADSFPYNPQNVLYNLEATKVPASAELNGKQWSDNTKQQVYEAVKYLVAEKIDITDTYDKWFRICYIFAGLFGEDGEDVFHAVSQFYPKYNAGECSRKFAYALNAYKPKGLTPATFFYILSDHNINLKDLGVIQAASVPQMPDVPPPTAEPEYLNGHHLDSPYIENLKLDELQGADVAGVLEGVPLIDAGIFDPSNTNSLPEPICEYLSSYEGRDRDLMMISLLGILSGVFDNVKVKYHKTEVPTLYTMIVTGAGSGKGYAERNNQLILGIDEKRRDQAIEDRKLWKVAKEKAKKEQVVFTEQEPPFRKLWSSGNVTAAKLVQDLANNTNLIISTTEADGIASKMNSAFGSEITEIFRKAYHQEAVTNETVKDGDQIAKNPLLSISILCTESQVSSIIQNVRDGLISRFSFYGFQDTFKFENPRQKAQNKDYQDKIDTLKTLVERLEQTAHELIVDFTEHQDDIITEMGKALAEQVKAIPDQDTSQLCTRGMVQFVRICAILTNLRRLEDLSNGFHPIKGEVECSTRDFETAKEIWKPIISTNLKMFAAMSEVAEKTGNEVVKATESGGMFELIDFLPEEFTTKDAVSCGAVKEISKRSVTRYLKEWRKNGYIEQITRGKYRKSSKSENL